LEWPTMEITSKPEVTKQAEPWICEGCLKQRKYQRVTVQICQDDALFIRGALGISKYGIIGKDFIEVCKDCIDTLRHR